jgi:hypothetical protein
VEIIVVATLTAAELGDMRSRSNAADNRTRLGARDGDMLASSFAAPTSF